MSQGRKFLKLLGIRAPQSASKHSDKKKLPQVRLAAEKLFDNENDCGSLSSFTPSEKNILNPEWLHQHSIDKVERWLSPQQHIANVSDQPEEGRNVHKGNLETGIEISENAGQAAKKKLFADCTEMNVSPEPTETPGSSELTTLKTLLPESLLSHADYTEMNVSPEPTETPGSPELTTLKTLLPESLLSHENNHVTPVGQNEFIVVQTDGFGTEDPPVTPEEAEISATPHAGPNVRKRLFSHTQSENMEVPEMPFDDPIEEENVVDLSSAAQQDVNTTTTTKRKRKNVPSQAAPSRKRKVNTARWKAVEAKLAFNSGIAHTSLRGKDRKAREMQHGCDGKCRRNCHSLITEERRKVLFNKYWGLKNKTLQWYFLTKLVHTINVKRRKVFVVEDEVPFRKKTYEYCLSDDSFERVQVCQKMFLNTFDISVKVVKTAVTKNSPDKRGKHNNRKTVSPILMDGVKAHIKSFPMVPSHYCRADSGRKYLDEFLTVAKMYRLYMMVKNVEDMHTASLRQYRDIFNSYFNLSFFKPKKDQCAECAEWNALTAEQKLLEDKATCYNNHRQAKEKVRALKRCDKETSREDKGKTMRVLTVDLQKVLYCPKSEVGEFFYKRKLSCYNYTVYDCSLKEGHLYVWDQTIGKRGSDEMTSCSLDYIERCAKAGVKVIMIYSDSCGGQNKNQYLYTMYYMAAMKFKVMIIHRYLEKGHTQMECDSVHARVEKKVRKEVIFTPAQYYGFMKTAKVNKPAYEVKEVSQNDIYSFRELSEGKFKWSKVPISKVKEVKVDFSSPGEAKYRLAWDGPEFSVKVLVQGIGRPFNWTTFCPKRAYHGRIPLPEKLSNDLQWYLNKKGLIPEAYRGYFTSLLNIGPSDPTDKSNSEFDDDLPQEIVPNGQVVENLLATEYEYQMEEADPFLDDRLNPEEADPADNSADDSDDFVD